MVAQLRVRKATHYARKFIDLFQPPRPEPIIRRSNTTVQNRNFDFLQIEEVWQKGAVIPGFDAHVFRKDKYGGWMKKSEFGCTDTDFGWQIDHIRPVIEGGTDQFENLQPLYWKFNRAKGDCWPESACQLTVKV